MLRGVMMEKPEAPVERPRAVRSAIRFLATIELEGGGAIDCEVVNISESGARIRLPDDFTIGTQLRLGFGRLGVFECRVAWSDDTQAGVQFVSGPFHVAKLIAEHFDNYRNSGENRQFIRSSILWKGELRVPGGEFSAGCNIFDISAGGARIRCPVALPSSLLELKMDRLGAFPVEVIWSKDHEFGLKFLVPPKRMAEVLGDLLPLCRVFPADAE